MGTMRLLSPFKRLLLKAASLLIAAAVYLPLMHLLYRPGAAEIHSDAGAAPMAMRMAARQERIWTDKSLLGGEIAKMRRANAEWDFMGRSFLVWSLGNLSLRDPTRAGSSLAAMDNIIDETLRLEREGGMYVFLMGYAQAKPWVQKPERSIFIDGEIALMLGVRCMVRPRQDYLDELRRRRVDVMAERMEASPSLSCESYPDECWTFCNTTALAAMRVSDRLLDTDHSQLIRRWITYSKANLIDPRTGMLISAYTLDGKAIYRPEGSTIWHVCHCLCVLDEQFGREQYELAKKQLADSIVGFGYAREWPAGIEDQMDVDSGMVVPVLGASVASSGLACLAAGTYGDVDFLCGLVTTIRLGGFPIARDGELWHAGANQVGDAVLLYGLTVGPIWQKLKEGGK